MKHNYYLSQRNKNFEYLVLPVREVENLLTRNQIEVSLPQIHNGFKKIDWSKVKLDEEKYMDNINKPFLGAELSKWVIKSGQNFPSSFLLKKSIRPNYKVKLANQIISNLIFSDLSIQAQEITKKVYNFIEESNQ